MRFVPIILIAALAWIADSKAETILQKSQRDEIVSVPNDDPDMAAAKRKARATLPEFLALAHSPRPSTINFAVKVGVQMDNGPDYEFFWIRPFEKSGDRYSGKLRNEPRWVKRLKLGDTIAFSESEIVDWTYLDAGKMKGNFTACALLKRESKANAAAFKKQYRLECDD